jgi:hypothetical protein
LQELVNHLHHLLLILTYVSITASPSSNAPRRRRLVPARRAGEAPPPCEYRRLRWEAAAWLTTPPVATRAGAPSYTAPPRLFALAAAPLAGVINVQIDRTQDGCTLCLQTLIDDLIAYKADLASAAARQEVSGASSDEDLSSSAPSTPSTAVTFFSPSLSSSSDEDSNWSPPRGGICPGCHGSGTAGGSAPRL